MLGIKNELRRIKNYVLFKKSLFMKKDFCEYHYFGFDTQKPLPNGSHIEMEVGCGVLKKLNLNYRLTDGTILGIYRDGGFIKHDNDIDIDVFDMSQDDIATIVESFSGKGFKVGRLVYYKNEIHQIAFYNEREVIFDIVFWYSKENKYVNHSERGYVRTQESFYFKQLKDIEFHSIKYKCPLNLEEWLEMRYGEFWQIPKKYKGDWKEDCFDLEKVK